VANMLRPEDTVSARTFVALAIAMAEHFRRIVIAEVQVIFLTLGARLVQSPKIGALDTRFFFDFRRHHAKRKDQQVSSHP
jgi:hypothetical protein